MEAGLKGDGAASGVSAAARPPRGRISFAAVPHETGWRQRLLQPLTLLTNGALTLWIYPAWRTARVRWDPPIERLLKQVSASGRPIIYYSWHAYEPTIFLAFRDTPEALIPTPIGHDGLLSRMLQRTGARFGYRLWIYRRKSPVSPKDQIIQMMKATKRNIGLIPDAGGPYRRVKPGIASIARATGAWLVPIITHGQPSLIIRWPVHFRFPLPFSSVTVFNGGPLDGASVTLEACQAALEDVEARASARPRRPSAR